MCGPGKSIAWNVIKDNIKIDDDVEVMLVGKENTPATSITASHGIPRASRGKVILSSVFVPGLGQKIASGKGGHLLFSGLVYGTAGASAYFFLKGNEYYSDYKNASGNEADILFSKSEKEYNTGRYLLYGAAGAWITNFIWSAVIPIKEKIPMKPALGLKASHGDGLLITAKWTF
jgi:hypothetical protein